MLDPLHFMDGGESRSSMSRNADLQEKIRDNGCRMLGDPRLIKLRKYCFCCLALYQAHFIFLFYFLHPRPTPAPSVPLQYTRTLKKGKK